MRKIFAQNIITLTHTDHEENVQETWWEVRSIIYRIICEKTKTKNINGRKPFAKSVKIDVRTSSSYLLLFVWGYCIMYIFYIIYRKSVHKNISGYF